MSEPKVEYRVEFYDHLNRPLLPGWSLFDAMAPLPEVGETFQIDNQEFPHIAQGPTYEVFKRHFFVKERVITAMIYSKDLNL